jgi:hypothetical protein
MSDLARLASHWLLGPLLPDGRDGGALFLAGAAAAMLASLALARRSSAAWLDRPDAAYLLLATVVFAHGVGLLALLGYQERLELPWQLGSYHWSGDAYLFNSLLHADLGRSALSTLLQALPAAAGDAFHAATGDARDGGTPLLAQVPAVERWTIGLLWIAALGAALAAAPAIARRHDWHPVAIGLFMLAALDALQAVVDGGALSLQLAPSLLMLARLSLDMAATVAVLKAAITPVLSEPITDESIALICAELSPATSAASRPGACAVVMEANCVAVRLLTCDEVNDASCALLRALSCNVPRLATTSVLSAPICRVDKAPIWALDNMKDIADVAIANEEICLEVMALKAMVPSAATCAVLMAAI